MSADAAAADPCRDSEECRTHGHCYALPFDTCGTGEDSCRYSYACLHQGQCTHDAASNRCIATSERDCRDATDCGDYGRCHVDVESGTCVVGVAECRDSNACGTEGLCTLQDGRCVIGSSEDCADSQQCSRHGRCTLVERACRPTLAEHCSASLECERSGRCHLVNAAGASVERVEGGGSCGHGGQCAESEACRNHGACTPDPRGLCVPASADHCAQSTACTREGKCTFVPPPPPAEPGGILAVLQGGIGPLGPVCIVGGPEDCEQVCAGQDHCGYMEDFLTGGTCLTFNTGILHGLDPGALTPGDAYNLRGLDGLSPDNDAVEGGRGTGTVNIGVRGGFGSWNTSPPPGRSDDDGADDDADSDGE